MSTDLAKQLRKIQQEDQALGGPSQPKNYKASFLFDPKEAADYDSDSIYTLGMDGLAELQQLDPVFLKFQSTLFSSQTRDLDRALLTAEENTQLDLKIAVFLRHLSPYFMQKAAHKVLEWLIRRFRINELNVEALIDCILPYHESIPFVRMVQILYFKEDDRWGFLFDVKKNAKVISRTYLALRCVADRYILNFVFDSAIWHCEKASEVRKRNIHVVPFFTYLCMEYIEQISSNQRLDLTHTAHLLPFVLASIKLQKSPDMQMAGYMMFIQLLEHTAFSTQVISEVLLTAAKFCADTAINECILFIARVLASSGSTGHSEAVFEHLAQCRTIETGIKKAASSFRIDAFLVEFLGAIKAKDGKEYYSIRNILEQEVGLMDISK